MLMLTCSSHVHYWVCFCVHLTSAVDMSINTNCSLSLFLSLIYDALNVSCVRWILKTDLWWPWLDTYGPDDALACVSVHKLCDVNKSEERWSTAAVTVAVCESFNMTEKSSSLHKWGIVHPNIKLLPSFIPILCHVTGTQKEDILRNVSGVLCSEEERNFGWIIPLRPSWCSWSYFGLSV